jgi:hypothetical protein
MTGIMVSSLVTMIFLTIVFGLIIPLKQVFADTVKMKVRVMCLTPSTGKYIVSVRYKGHNSLNGFIPAKNGEKQSKTLDLGKIAKKTGDDQYIVSFKFKNVKIGYDYQAESKSLKKKFSFRESIGYEEHGQDMLFPIDTHTCRKG